MTSPALSVIVPVYNQEDWLRPCLASLAAQDVPNAEFLVVDDGSTDGSRSIIEEFTAADSRFRLIVRENGGYGAALNSGLDAAGGEWIGIVESDDECMPTMYPNLLKKAASAPADAVKAGFREIDENSRAIGEGSAGFRPAPDGEMYRPCEAPDIYVRHQSLWSGIYRRSFLEEHGIRCIECHGGYQDASFSFAFYLHSPRIIHVDQRLYLYRRFRMGNTMGHGGKVEAALSVLDNIIGSVVSPETACCERAPAIRGVMAIMAWHFLRLDDVHWMPYAAACRERMERLENDVPESYAAAMELSRGDLDRIGIIESIHEGRYEDTEAAIRRLRDWRKKAERVGRTPLVRVLRRWSRKPWFLKLKSAHMRRRDTAV